MQSADGNKIPGLGQALVVSGYCVASFQFKSQYDMKKLIPAFSLLTTIFSSCNNVSYEKIKIPDDSLKKIILELNTKLTSLKKENPSDSKVYESFCEDSLLAMYDQDFSSSSYDVSHDLGSGIVVRPHDFTFRIYPNTVILSYLSTPYELINTDTVFHDIRTMETFVLDNNEWKLASSCASLQGKNYYKPSLKQPINYYGIPGVYKWTETKFDSFYVKDGMLYDSFNGEAPTMNYTVDDSTFMINNDLGKINFIKDKNGIATAYSYTRYDGQKIRIPKMK